MTVQDRLWSKVDAGGDCWMWTGMVNASGYGQMYVGPDVSRQYVHRVAWELLVGPIPDGFTIDHLCRNRRCVNPDHLEPVTPKENTQRGIRANQPTCIRDHPLWGENLYTCKNGSRRCRQCSADRSRRYHRQVAV